MPEGESENLRDLEEHAAEAKDEQGGNADPETDEQPTADSDDSGGGEVGSDAGTDSDYGVENDMRPGGPAAGEADADGPTKSISEDVTGKEETEDMSELHTDD